MYGVNKATRPPESSAPVALTFAMVYTLVIAAILLAIFV